MTVYKHGAYTMPEPPTEPPEPHYVTADCTHEVYDGEIMVTWEGKTLCPDCFMDRVREMSIAEVAALFGCTYETIGG